MAEQTPTVGRIVYYKLSEQDALSINKRRKDFQEDPKKEIGTGEQYHVGNRVEVGQIVAAIVVAVWSPTLLNLKCMLDGNDDLWVTGAQQGDQDRNWDWMPFQKDQQKRVEAMADAEIEKRTEEVK